MPSILALITVMILVSQAAAGNWTEHQFFYKPSPGARGEMQKREFDSGLDRVDAHLGRYKTLGDPGYETLPAALTTIGSNERTLLIPAGAVSIAANTTIPANVHLKVLKGGCFDIADGVTLTINGPFEAGLYQVFSWAGTGKAVFGNDAVERVFPEWWGGKADGATECATAFQKAFDAFPAVKLGKGSYKLTDTSILLNSVIVAMGYTLRGEWAETKLLLYGYNDKYAFHLNADAAKVRVIDWPQGPRLVVEDLMVHGGNSTNANFLYVDQCCVTARNLRFNYMYRGFYFANYCDRLTIRDIHWQQPHSNGQFLYVRQGDALIIDGINFFPHGEPGCNINYSGGFRVSNLIGGIHKFENCQGGVFENCHLESGGELKIGNSTMTVRSNFFYDKNSSGYSILCDGQLGSYWHGHNHVIFEDNVFSCVCDLAGTIRRYAIKIENPNSRDIYTFRNNVGNLAAPSSEFVSEKVGILVGSSNATLGPFLEKYKGLMSGNITIAYDQHLTNWRVHDPGAREVYHSPQPALDWAGESSKPSNLPQGTYYYRFAWYNDVGHSNKSAETSRTTSANNKSITLTVHNSKQPFGFMRFWRGTASGVYDRYVDIPLCGVAFEVHDMGDTLSGHQWLTTSVPTPPNDNTSMDGIVTSRGKRQFWASAVPTSGEFVALQGDIVWNTAPSAGGAPGWVCTTAGSPGTWKAMANLAN